MKPSSNKIQLFIGALLALLCYTLPAQAVEPKKDQVPESLCITNETIAMHAATIARFEKDTAPYKENPLAETAIKEYKDKIDTAWSALQQPYCGYGSSTAYNATKKSYNKTVVRAQDAFAQAAKSLAKGVVPDAPTANAPAEVKQNVLEEVSAKTSVPAAPARSEETVHAGLKRGQRSGAVLDLQRRLVNHFGLPDDGSLTTGYFGPKTEDLVIKFQIEQHLIDGEDDPAAGLVGPKTTKALLDL